MCHLGIKLGNNNKNWSPATRFGFQYYLRERRKIQRHMAWRIVDRSRDRSNTTVETNNTLMMMPLCRVNIISSLGFLSIWTFNFFSFPFIFMSKWSLRRFFEFSRQLANLCDLWATHKNQRLIAYKSTIIYQHWYRITMCMRVIIQSISHWLSWIQFSMTFFCLSNSLAVSRKFVIVYLPLWFTLDDMKKRFQSVEIAGLRGGSEGVLVLLNCW